MHQKQVEKGQTLVIDWWNTDVTAKLGRYVMIRCMQDSSGCRLTAECCELRVVTSRDLLEISCRVVLFSLVFVSLEMRNGPGARRTAAAAAS